MSNLLTGETLLQHKVNNTILDNIVYDAKRQEIVCQSYGTGTQHRLSFSVANPKASSGTSSAGGIGEPYSQSYLCKDESHESSLLLQARYSNEDGQLQQIDNGVDLVLSQLSVQE